MACRSFSETCFSYCWFLTGKLLLIPVVNKSYHKCFSFNTMSDLEGTTFLLYPKATRCKKKKKKKSLWYIRRPAESGNTFYCFIQSFLPILFLFPSIEQYNTHLTLSVLPPIRVFSLCYPVGSCVTHLLLLSRILPPAFSISLSITQQALWDHFGDSEW